VEKKKFVFNLLTARIIDYIVEIRFTELTKERYNQLFF